MLDYDKYEVYIPYGERYVELQHDVPSCIWWQSTYSEVPTVKDIVELIQEHDKECTANG